MRPATNLSLGHFILRESCIPPASSCPTHLPDSSCLTAVPQFLLRQHAIDNAARVNRTGVALDILTKPPISPAVKTLCQAFKTQRGSLAVKTFSAFHDRFVVIDNSAVYHFGASLKDLGKKTFRFSLIEEPEIVAALHARIATEWRAAAVEI